MLAIGEALLFLVVITFSVSVGLPGHWIAFDSAPRDLISAFSFAAWIVLITTMMMGATGLYNRDVMFEIDAVIARAALSFSMAFAIFSCIELARSSWEPSHFEHYKTAAIAIPACVIISLLVRSVFAGVAKKEILKRRILVVGRGRNAVKIAKMDRVDRYRFKVVGYIDFGTDQDSFPLEPLFPGSAIATPEAAMALAKAHNIQGIVVASGERRGLPNQALFQCRMTGIRIEDFPTFWESHAGHIDLDSLTPGWLTYSDGFTMNRDRLIAKTCFDYAIASILLLVTAPIMILTAIMIKATSKGPILFRQERVGRNGKIFNVLKIRSMAVDAENSGPQWAKANDARVTAIGRFIRKLRIDEIPQAINILKGEMSFVGPRPERPHFVTQLSKAIPYFEERHRIRPGLSGWAQINYPYGASVEDARNKLSYDLYYMKNGSIFLDVLILLRTVHVILWPRGAR